jgi:hypothetical protein
VSEQDEPPAVEPTRERAARPRVVVRAFEEIGAPGPDVPTPAPASSATPASSRPSTREEAAEVVMAAPVEMWFGESRVGVRAPSPTYDRFRKYADVLLGDLKAALRQTR